MAFMGAFVWTVAFVTLIARKQIVEIFTDDNELVSMTAGVLIIVGLSFVMDGLQGVCQGPIRALGLQMKASYIAIGSYWLFGLPVAYLLAF
mmetsp:Transcript_13630/g.18646  ORF Transcript_13630/g.18646 Transcript_13630/m.18646 type:complete len:91 (-) Transcript_13630:269-541(-)|eukprot:CAMPEP_0185573412 /NCGR_PEP_ID=MMETSP0434-20130131/5129_1 /TAXON_ID=626734 ORGANISM="Favella taraikaensis, Strain Fe Narragansett Bay" /NCGR_SAMPLE_ID=MMETSP0434 /ASSEMBLY_ACC=CAM_ASM_000379 /LENGTH=90 /DNA_ID=CAMNT_0028189625 /DNA_START=982 /DNA_END=1254 /DNA_ORIENTATION=+